MRVCVCVRCTYHLLCGAGVGQSPHAYDHLDTLVPVARQELLCLSVATYTQHTALVNAPTTTARVGRGLAADDHDMTQSKYNNNNNNNRSMVVITMMMMNIRTKAMHHHLST